MVLPQTCEKDDVVLQFGQGRIIFCVDAFGNIGVYITDDARDVGTSAIDIDIGDAKYFPIPITTNIEYTELETKLAAVTIGIKRFRYKNFIFDFTAYNKKSVDIVINTLRKSQAIRAIPLAC